MPTDPTQRVRRYSSPPRRSGSWNADRPGDLADGQPSGVRLGNQGPDQGYALKLVHQFDDRLHLGALDRDDVDAGCVAVAMKRAAAFGRAPVIHDLTVAYTVFGFLDTDPAPELVELRDAIFPEVHSNHHYVERREIVDLVPESVLRRPHSATGTLYANDWRKNLDL